MKYSFEIAEWNLKNIHCRYNLTAILQELQEGNKHQTQTQYYERMGTAIIAFYANTRIWTLLPDGWEVRDIEGYPCVTWTWQHWHRLPVRTTDLRDPDFCCFSTNVCRAWQIGVKSLVFVNQTQKTKLGNLLSKEFSLLISWSNNKQCFNEKIANDNCTFLQCLSGHVCIPSPDH